MENNYLGDVNAALLCCRSYIRIQGLIGEMNAHLNTDTHAALPVPTILMHG